MRFSKLSWFVRGKQIKYLLKLKAEANTCNIDLCPPSLISNLNHTFVKLIKLFTWLFPTYKIHVNILLRISVLDLMFDLLLPFMDRYTCTYTGHVVGSRPMKWLKDLFFSCEQQDFKTLRWLCTFAWVPYWILERKLQDLTNDDYWTRTWNISLLFVYMYQLHYPLTHSFMS